MKLGIKIQIIYIQFKLSKEKILTNKNKET